MSQFICAKNPKMFKDPNSASCRKVAPGTASTAHLLLTSPLCRQLPWVVSEPCPRPCTPSIPLSSAAACESPQCSTAGGRNSAERHRRGSSPPATRPGWSGCLLTPPLPTTLGPCGHHGNLRILGARRMLRTVSRRPIPSIGPRLPLPPWIRLPGRRKPGPQTTSFTIRPTLGCSGQCTLEKKGNSVCDIWALFQRFWGDSLHLI